MRMRPIHQSLNNGLRGERAHELTLSSEERRFQSLPESHRIARDSIEYPTRTLARPEGTVVTFPSGNLLDAILNVKCANLHISTSPYQAYSTTVFTHLGASLNMCQCQPFTMCHSHNHFPSRTGLHQKHKNLNQKPTQKPPAYVSESLPNQRRQIYHQIYQIVLKRKIWLTIWRLPKRHKIQHTNRHKNPDRLSPHRCLKSSRLLGEVLGEIAPFTKLLNC